MFKKSILSALLTLSLFAASAAHADTVTSNFAVSGNFSATCSISSLSIALGSVDLSAYVGGSSSTTYQSRVPVVIPVVCNSSTVAWSMYHSSDAGFPMTIGAETGNLACLISPTANVDSPVCPVLGGYNLITGVGSVDAPALLAIWHPGTAGDPTRKAFRGSGAISATIPMTLEF